MVQVFAEVLKSPILRRIRIGTLTLAKTIPILSFATRATVLFERYTNGVPGAVQAHAQIFL